MDITSPTYPCYFLARLPMELRREVYNYFVRFDAPIKLRQVIPGSRDLPILRTCRQIHDEALAVLYELNTIVVTRNDFCIHTDPGLKTPLRLDQIRHLHLSGFSQSIACTLRGPERRCTVCHPSASGLFEILRTEMPKLRSVAVDFTRHAAELAKLREANPGILGGKREFDEKGRAVKELQGECVKGLSVKVVYLPGVIVGGGMAASRMLQ